MPRLADPLDWLLADERRRLVRTAIGQLRPRDAEILLLKYQEDWNYAQLAAHLGVSTSAVEARLHRARERLRQQLSALELAEVPTSIRFSKICGAATRACSTAWPMGN